MTPYDQYLPVASKLIKGLAAKPGVKIVNQQITADFLAQALHAAIKRGELDPKPTPQGSHPNNTGDKP